jgi:hypothetical protein
VVESVFLGVLQQGARQRMLEELLVNFVGVEAAPRLEDAMDLPERRSPVGNVMNDGKSKTAS